MLKRILVVACSATKRTGVKRSGRPVEAQWLYDGSAWRTVRANRVHDDPSTALWALSARHGLIPADHPIHWYEQRLEAGDWSLQRMRFGAHARRFAEQLEELPPSFPVLVFGGELYHELFDHILGGREFDLHYDTTSGGIGRQLGQLKGWIHD